MTLVSKAAPVQLASLPVSAVLKLEHRTQDL